MQMSLKEATTTDKAFDHITQEDRDSVSFAADKATKMVESHKAAHAASSKTQPPVVLVADIEAE
ncbi:hypothetical protein T484DRAFT_1806993, partial [Baffinella frigidus]